MRRWERVLVAMVVGAASVLAGAGAAWAVDPAIVTGSGSIIPQLDTTPRWIQGEGGATLTGKFGSSTVTTLSCSFVFASDIQETEVFGLGTLGVSCTSTSGGSFVVNCANPVPHLSGNTFPDPRGALTYERLGPVLVFQDNVTTVNGIAPPSPCNHQVQGVVVFIPAPPSGPYTSFTMTGIAVVV